MSPDFPVERNQTNESVNSNVKLTDSLIQQHFEFPEANIVQSLQNANAYSMATSPLNLN